LSLFSACAPLFLVVFSVVANAQPLVTISGDLFANSGRISGAYQVELTNLVTNAPIERTVSDGAGKFEFRNVAAGRYTVLVKTGTGDVIGLHDVTGAMGSAQVHVQIVEPVAKNSPVSGTVSAVSLMHHPPKKAIREMNAAIRAGHTEVAQEHLRAALLIDPDFSEAHTNLGSEYTRAGKLDLAYAEFDAALKTGSQGAMEYCNIAVVALAMNRIDEAEREVRRALSVESRYPQANYLLGRILAGEPGHYQEAVKYLKLAAPDIPNANLLLQKMTASLR
jgi:tetratricopeptide (TPR) repeat protein